MGRTRRIATLCLLPVVWLLVGAGCSDDDRESVEESIAETRETIEDSVGAASARAVAESFRVSLMAQDEDGPQRRHVMVMRRAVENIPGDPEVSGIEDRDGDGTDDDGVVEFRVGDQGACAMVDRRGDIQTEGDMEACDRMRRPEVMP